jgi:resuscitation-promoting factor RpfB
MKHIFHYSAAKIGVMVAVCAIFIGLTSFVLMTHVGAASTDQARDGRLVTIHDRGSEKVILTHAQSIQDALQDADINLDARDTVEPGLNEKLVATDYTVNIYRARPVVVIDGAVREKVMTPYQSADKIAADAGIELHDEDKTSILPSSDVVSDGAGLVMTIDRATAFTLMFYGTHSSAYTQAKTVGDMLKQKHITLAANDTLSVPETTLMTSGMTVEIWRNGEQTATQQEPIAFSVRQIQDVDHPVGYRQVQTPGENGSKDVTYRIVMKNGKEVNRSQIQSVVTKQPKEQVEVVGTKPSFSGDFAAALAKLRSCEGSYTSWNPAGPYYGAYQFNEGTWKSVSSAPYGHATPAEQDAAAHALYVRRGWQPWPNCGRNLPDTYR